MAASPPLSIPPSPVDLPNAEDESLLRIQVSDPRLPLGNIFVRVYEHLDYLREMGHHEAADKMDKSRSVSRLIEIASGDGWQSFDTIWSAKEFREILYHAIAPQKGGPLWFRESARKLILEDICMTQMPHVWKTLFDQAKDSISVFVDPHSPRHAHLIQQISFQDMTALQGLRAQSSGALSLKDVEHTFFPKASPSPHTVRSSTSQVTGKTYKHSVKILLTLDPQEYMDIFHRLARRALDRTPPPSPVTWNDLGKLAREVGLLTKDVLRHVAFWFAGHDIDETFLRTPSRSWSDLLGAGPFATRASRNGSSLTHADQSPDEAARLFIQALFDQIRVGFERDWKDEATKEMAYQPPKRPSPNVKSLSEHLQHTCYRYRFQTPAWLGVLDLVQGYVGPQFHGVMEPYNETPRVISSLLRTSLQSTVEQCMVTARLSCMGIPFLSTAEALRDLTVEMEIFSAMYLYRRCKMFAASGHEVISGQASNVGDDVQRVSPEQGQRVRMIIHELARILQDVGYDPQPDGQDEQLDRFSLKSTGYYLLAEPNLQHASRTSKVPHTLESNTAILTDPTGGVPSSPYRNLRDVLTGVSIIDSDVTEEDRPRIKKRRRNADR